MNFEAIKSVAAKGQTLLANEYESTDPLSNVTVNYRIRSVDHDGKSAYTDVKTITAGKTVSSAEITCFPNPATTNANIKLNVPEATTLYYNIYTQDGRKVQAGSKALDKGMTTISVNFSAAVPHNAMLTMVLENNKSGVKESLRIFRL
jgi:hypothetical protein